MAHMMMAGALDRVGIQRWKNYLRLCKDFSELSLFQECSKIGTPWYDHSGS